MEPVAEVTAAGRGDRVGQRGRYGIDGGYAGLAVFGVIEAGWRAPWPGWRARARPGIAVLAAVGGTAVAGSAASYLYSTGPGKRAIWRKVHHRLRRRLARSRHAGTQHAGPAAAGELLRGTVRGHAPPPVSGSRADPRRAASPQDPGRVRPARSRSSAAPGPAAGTCATPTRPRRDITARIERSQVPGGLLSDYRRAA